MDITHTWSVRLDASGLEPITGLMLVTTGVGLQI